MSKNKKFIKITFNENFDMYWFPDEELWEIHESNLPSGSIAVLKGRAKSYDEALYDANQSYILFGIKK